MTASARRLVLFVLALVLLVAGAGAGTAGAGDAREESVRGLLSTEAADDEGDGERVPLVGVEIVVREGADEIGRATSDDEGAWEVPVPGPGTYEVELVADTLPEGASLRAGTSNVLGNVVVDPGQAKTVRFLFGEFTGGTPTLERLVNLAAQGVKFGSIIALTAVGLSLIFGITGLVNFAHGELVAFGALIAWFLNASDGGPGLHLIVAAALAVVAGAAAGFGLDAGLWHPLRSRHTGQVALLVVSIGLTFILRHVYLVIYGGQSRPFRNYAVQRAFEVGPVAMPPKDYAITGVALVVLALVGLMLQRTRIGTAMRAVADNRDLAESSGIDVERVIRVTWVLGAALAALGGVLQGVTEAIVWDMGFALLLLMFAAVIVGGLGTAFGAMAGGLLIGVVAQVSTFWLSTEFKLAVAMAVLIGVLMFRPQGIFGQAQRVG